MQSSLGSLQRIQELQERTTERISTGRDSSFVDDPVAASISSSLSNRASDFLNVKDHIGQAASSVETAVNGLDSISQLLQQARGLAEARQSTSDANTQADLDAQFNVVAEQITNISRDASFGGTSLISSAPDNLDVSLNPDGSSSVTVTGEASDAATLGIDITDPASIDAALGAVRASAQTIGSNAAVLDIRENFTRDLVNGLQEGAAKLVETDLNEEAANALSAQTRGALGTVALQIATESERAIFELF